MDLIPSQHSTVAEIGEPRGDQFGSIKKTRHGDPATGRGARELDRRALLRSGGAVLAGVVGLGAAQTVAAGGADAAPGAPMLLGVANDAGTSATALTSAVTSGATLALGNTASAAPLQLTEQTPPASVAGLASGALANFDGDLYYTAGGAGGPFVGFVYTAFTANQLVPITPQRIVDTRNSVGRANITHPAGNLDSAGRLLAGHTIVIKLTSLEVAAQAAYCNLTAVGPLAAGFMTLWPGGPRPTTSSINYPARAVIANFAVTGTSATDTVSIYSSATTHLLLDIAAFAVGSPGQINPKVLAAPSTSTHHRLAAHAAAGTLPRWHPGT